MDKLIGEISKNSSSPSPESFNIKGKLLFIVIAVVVLSGLILFFRPQLHMSGSINKLASGKIPPSLPQDIVLAINPQIIDGYTAVTPNGGKQSSLVYSTEMDPSVLINKYAEYFYKNGWTIGSSYLPNLLQNGDKDLVREDKKYILDVSKDTSKIQVLILADPSSSDAWRISINLVINTK